MASASVAAWARWEEVEAEGLRGLCGAERGAVDRAFDQGCVVRCWAGGFGGGLHLFDRIGDGPGDDGRPVGGGQLDPAPDHGVADQRAGGVVHDDDLDVREGGQAGGDGIAAALAAGRDGGDFACPVLGRELGEEALVLGPGDEHDAVDRVAGGEGAQ